MPTRQRQFQEDADDDDEEKAAAGEEGQTAADMASADNVIAVSLAVPQLGAAADITSACEF